MHYAQLSTIDPDFLKAKLTFPIHPELQKFNALAQSLEQEVFEYATTMAEYVDLLVNQVRLLSDYSVALPLQRSYRRSAQ